MISAATYHEIIKEEYAWLRERLSLREVPLLFDHGNDKGWPRYGVPGSRTPMGRALRPVARRVFFRRGAPGWIGRVLLPRCIIMPYSDGDLGGLHDIDIVRARVPPGWRRLTQPRSRDAYIFWDDWRTTFWHEVCHQAQDEKDFGWNPHDGYEGHGPSWDAALVWMASQLSAPPADLKRLIPPMARIPGLGL